MKKIDRIKISRDTSIKYKNLMLETFKFTAEYLKINHLRYIACGGTVLGAVRHKGFIPWDDDIDIYMPRKDYEKLLSLDADLQKHGYEVFSYSTPGYYLPFAKISNRKTTLWETKQIPFVIGVFVDIFPLDEFDCSDEDIINIQNKSNIYFHEYEDTLIEFRFSDIIYSALHLDYNRTKQIIKLKYGKNKRLEKLEKYIKYIDPYMSNKGDKCVCLTQWVGKIFKTEWFEDTIEVPFEDTTIVIPRDFDSYLSLLYGDYMTPPSQNERISNHYLYYINLEERKTIEEIRELKK